MSIIGGGTTDNKALQESRDTLQDLNKSIKEFNRQSVRYSRALIWLTVLLFIIAVIQTIILLKTVSKTDWAWGGLIILLFVIVYFIMRAIEKEIKK